MAQYYVRLNVTEIDAFDRLLKSSHYFNLYKFGIFIVNRKYQRRTVDKLWDTIELESSEIVRIP